jgi:hypothetical protein
VAITEKGRDLLNHTAQALEEEIERLRGNAMHVERRRLELSYARDLVTIYGPGATHAWPSDDALLKARDEIERQLLENDRSEFRWSPHTKGDAVIARRTPEAFMRRVMEAMIAQGLPPLPEEIMHEPRDIGRLV